MATLSLWWEGWGWLFVLVLVVLWVLLMTTTAVRRTLPLGLQVIGVHSPEYAFEKEVDNVRGGAADLGITIG